MKISDALSELAQATAAARTDADTRVTTAVATSRADDAESMLVVSSYVSIIVVVTVMLFLSLGLAVYKSYTTLMSMRTTRRRHGSGRWLTPDNPDMWTSESYTGQCSHLSIRIEFSQHT